MLVNTPWRMKLGNIAKPRQIIHRLSRAIRWGRDSLSFDILIILRRYLHNGFSCPPFRAWGIQPQQSQTHLWARAHGNAPAPRLLYHAPSAQTSWSAHAKQTPCAPRQIPLPTAPDTSQRGMVTRRRLSSAAPRQALAGALCGPSSRYDGGLRGQDQP